MSDIITTLHPQNDENINLYPNIKKENIPNNAVDLSKLDDNVKSLINSLKPSGTDTSTNILAFTYNKGVYVATDNGHWYYWNGSQYADGGVFQATELSNPVSTEISKIKNIIGEVNYFSDDFSNGYYYDDTASLVSNDNSLYLPEIDLKSYRGGYVKIMYKNIASSSPRNIIFKITPRTLSRNFMYVKELNFSPIQNEFGYYEVDFPIYDYYESMLFSISTASNIVSLSIFKADVLKNDIVNIVNSKEVLYDLPMFTGANTNRCRTYTLNNSELKYKKIIIKNIPENIGATIFYRLSSTQSSDSSNAWDYSGELSIDISNMYDFHFEFRKLDNSVFSSGEYTSLVNSLKYYNCIYSVSSQGNLTLFVSPNGNDNGIGSSSNPLATINKALELGANTIYLLDGIYTQQINLSKALLNDIKISKYNPTGKVLFKDNSGLIGTSAELVTGYTKVYKIQCNITIPENCKWLFQENVNDVSTLIIDSERVAEERGYNYRCLDTKIVLCSANNLSDALNEIENNNAYKWFYYDGYIYFSSPQTLTSDYPLITSLGNNLFLNNTSNISILISGIDTKYYIFNVNNLNNTNIVDCSSSNVFGAGAFTYDNCLNVVFKRCEAVRCYGLNGDGFNGHSTNSGEIYSHQTTCQLINCWAHDNNDDGYSDHEKCEVNIYGGLYEYNGKAGITPSYGTHCVCYNVISRNNDNGFYYGGQAIDSGKYGQLTCFNCIAENNGDSGFRVADNGNTLLLINCISKNNIYGYRNLTEAYSKLFNCYSLNNTNIKSGNFTILNANLVE